MPDVPLPFSREEYSVRLAKVRNAMAEAGIEVLFTCDPSNMAWLTGYDGWSFYVHQCVLVGPDGAPLWFGRGQDANGAVRNWTYSQADNFLRAALTVDQVPSSGKIVIGQIHVYESTQPLLKVEYQYKDATHMGNIVAKVRFHPKDKKARVITIAEDVPLNETFNYVIHLNKAGLLSVTARGMVWNDRISATWSKQQLYFKAGVYCQDNTGYTSEGGKAMFFNLDTDHNKG